MKKKLILALCLILSATLIFCSCGDTEKPNENIEVNSSSSQSYPEDYIASVNDAPEFSGEPYVAIRNNEPQFDSKDLVTKSYESYSKLDSFGRCGVVMACIGTDIMPTEERGSIGQVKPTGWHTVKYDIVDGKYLYNRCHLIGFQLTGENANEQNLITGTRYLNIEGMLPFENMIADYVRETENHVIYRVTPVYKSSDLLASGVQMEAFSVEDNGEGICFNVYAYNSQPGIEINYSNGESKLAGDKITPDGNETETEYILNTNSKKFHTANCSLAKDIKASNKKLSKEDRSTLLEKGYSPCKGCNP
ncbi:MAG: hypothetical protein E7524_02330 [Ruminococcaceae bacterium]|nr:hypothetical protein [Oscillospiraceae bacterium]